MRRLLKKNESVPEGKKKAGKLAAVGGILLCLAAAGGGVAVWKGNQTASDAFFPERGGRGSGAEALAEGEYWYASGLTGVGRFEDSWELDYLDIPLVVEEAFLHTGDEVKEGDQVFQVSQVTLEAGRKQLESREKETRLESRQGLLDYETGKIEAKGVYEQALIAGDYAQSDYQAALAQAQEQVSSLQSQVEEAQETVDTDTASVEEDYYYDYYQVAERKQLYEENFTYLMQLYGDWDIAELESSSSASQGYTGIPTSLYTNSGSGTAGQSAGGSSMTDISGQKAGSSGGSSSETGIADRSADGSGQSVDSTGGSGQSVDSTGGSGQSAESSESGDPESAASGQGSSVSGNAAAGMPGGGSGHSSYQVSDEASKLAVYQLFDAEVTKEAEAYQEAKEQYEEAAAKAAAGLDAAKSELKILQAQLTEAQTNYELEKLTAQTEAEQKKADSERAQEVYENSLKQLEETYESVKEAEEEAKEQLELFEATIGDGFFYAGCDGTVILSQLQAGQKLSEKSVLAAYSDPETVTVAVSVDQEDIAKVGIGDEVLAVINGYGACKGTVTSFNPAAQSESRSRVEYTVTVTLAGEEVQELEANLTAYVYFGLTEEQKAQLRSQAEARPSDVEGNQEKGMTAPAAGGESQTEAPAASGESQIAAPDAGGESQIAAQDREEQVPAAGRMADE